MSNPEPTYYVYVLTISNHTTRYVDVSGTLKKRLNQHKARGGEGFTKKYNLNKLVYFEKTQFVNNAIKREKQLKKWKRQWKANLIDDINPDWEDFAWISGD